MRWRATRPVTARLSKACSSATSASKKSSKIKGFQGNHSEKGGSLFYFSAISLLVWTLFHPSSMSFLCRAQTTMSCYVTNFESLLLKEFSSNGMIKPLNAIISVAIFSVNFPLQRKKGRNLLQPFWIFISFFDSSQHLFHTIYN